MMESDEEERTEAGLQKLRRCAERVERELRVDELGVEGDMRAVEDW